MIISQDLFYSFIQPEELKCEYVYKTFLLSLITILLLKYPLLYCSNELFFFFSSSLIHKGSMNMNINNNKKKREKCLVHEYTTGEKSTTFIRGSNIKITH